MAQPSDEALYAATKKQVDKMYDKPSAYRSMAYSRFYLRAYREKYGNDKKAYKGRNPGELERWRREKWVDIRSYVEDPKDTKPCGSIEYGKDEYPLCMPLSRAKRYSEKQLVTLLNRKAELGKERLVKEPFLRDIGIEPKPAKLTERKPIKEKKPEKPEPKPRGRPRKPKQEIVVEKKARGRPKRVAATAPVRAERTKEEANIFVPSEKPKQEEVLYDVNDPNLLKPSKSFETGFMSWD